MFTTSVMVNSFDELDVGKLVILTVKFPLGLFPKKQLPVAKFKVNTFEECVTDAIFSVRMEDVINAEGVKVVQAKVPTLKFEEPLKMP